MALDKATQKAVLFQHMKHHAGGISTLEAIKLYGIVRPAARIADLRDDGHIIRTERVPVLDDDGKEISHYAQYHLVATTDEVDRILAEDLWNECDREARMEDAYADRDEDHDPYDDRY